MGAERRGYWTASMQRVHCRLQFRTFLSGFCSSLYLGLIFPTLLYCFPCRLLFPRQDKERIGKSHDERERETKAEIHDLMTALMMVSYSFPPFTRLSSSPCVFSVLFLFSPPPQLSSSSCLICILTLWENDVAYNCSLSIALKQRLERRWQSNEQIPKKDDSPPPTLPSSSLNSMTWGEVMSKEEATQERLVSSTEERMKDTIDSFSSLSSFFPASSLFFRCSFFFVILWGFFLRERIERLSKLQFNWSAFPCIVHSLALFRRLPSPSLLAKPSSSVVLSFHHIDVDLFTLVGREQESSTRVSLFSSSVIVVFSPFQNSQEKEEEGNEI